MAGDDDDVDGDDDDVDGDDDGVDGDDEDVDGDDDDDDAGYQISEHTRVKQNFMSRMSEI